MISETGENLDVIILTQTAEDWRTFATWYSVQANLPDASVSILCHRTTRVEFQFYQWAKRLNIPLKIVTPFYKEQIGDKLNALKLHMSTNVLILDYTTLVLDVLSKDWIDMFSGDPKLIIDDHCVTSRNITIEDMDLVINNFVFTGTLKAPAERKLLLPEAKECEEPLAIATYSKGCGKWIDTMRGCPFSNADGLIGDSMTVNELRIVQLWRRMVALFSAVN